MFVIPPADGSRDARIEDPTNLWLIHPIARMLLPLALKMGVSANFVSCCGLVLGGFAAFAFAHWPDPVWMAAALVLSVLWLIADGLDGIVARATGTASKFGRFMDGLCDHGVFILIYVSLVLTIGTGYAFALAAVAGLCHAIQSSLYEGERARFHRRRRGDPGAALIAPEGNVLVRGYDAISFSLDRFADPIDSEMRIAADPLHLGQAYTDQAVPVMRLMALLTANSRIIAIWAACLLGNPNIAWWIEIVPMTAIAITSMLLLRHAETRVLSNMMQNGARISTANPSN